MSLRISVDRFHRRCQIKENAFEIFNSQVNFETKIKCNLAISSPLYIWGVDVTNTILCQIGICSCDNWNKYTEYLYYIVYYSNQYGVETFGIFALIRYG